MFVYRLLELCKKPKIQYLYSKLNPMKYLYLTLTVWQVSYNNIIRRISYITVRTDEKNQQIINNMTHVTHDVYFQAQPGNQKRNDRTCYIHFVYNFGRSRTITVIKYFSQLNSVLLTVYTYNAFLFVKNYNRLHFIKLSVELLYYVSISVY